MKVYSNIRWEKRESSAGIDIIKACWACSQHNIFRARTKWHLFAVYLIIRILAISPRSSFFQMSYIQSHNYMYTSKYACGSTYPSSCTCKSLRTLVMKFTWFRCWKWLYPNAMVHHVRHTLSNNNEDDTIKDP